MINLPIGKYRFDFQAQEDIFLPAYSGSSWRGLFGLELKRSVCVTREKQCKNCMLWRNCAYTYLFETPPAEDARMMRKYTAAPYPFIIQPDPHMARLIKAQQSLSIMITLIGKANQHLPYFIHTFQQAGKRGLGARRGKFSLQSVSQIINNEHFNFYAKPYGAHGDTLQESSNMKAQVIYNQQQPLQALPIKTPEIPPLTATNITLQFLTPYRTRSHNQTIDAEKFNFYHLLSPLLRRLSSLSYFHADTELKLDFANLTAHAREVTINTKKLHWHDWKRYSSRQQNEIKMGGVVGTVEFSANEIKPFWELLYLGQFINVGKGTVMGLGKYVIL